MPLRWSSALAAGVLLVSGWLGLAGSAHAQGLDPNRFYHYPYYYFPHDYWPQMGPKWPEPVGAPYQRPPAYMAYPAFREPMWHYEWWRAPRYYRGSHFWLDVF